MCVYTHYSCSVLFACCPQCADQGGKVKSESYNTWCYDELKQRHTVCCNLKYNISIHQIDPSELNCSEDPKGSWRS